MFCVVANQVTYTHCGTAQSCKYMQNAHAILARHTCVCVMWPSCNLTCAHNSLSNISCNLTCAHSSLSNMNNSQILTIVVKFKSIRNRSITYLLSLVQTRLSKYVIDLFLLFSLSYSYITVGVRYLCYYTSPRWSQGWVISIS